MKSSADLAAMLCSRLCHDMLSPIGALNNGLELLADEDDPAMREKCFELLEQSARTSALKLKFFRLAFGAAGGFGELVPVEEPRELITELAAANSRVTLEWSVSLVKMSKPAVKTLLNLAAIGLESLVRGGTLAIDAEQKGGRTEIAIRAEGGKVAFDNNIGQALTGELPDSEISSRTAAAHMLHLLMEENGGTIQFAKTDGMLVLGAILPDASDLIG